MNAPLPEPRTPAPLRVVLLLAAALLGSLALAQEPPLAITLRPFLVETVTLEDGTLAERFTPAESARPGQVVEYRLEVTNESDAPLAADEVAVVGPVPDATYFLPGSAVTGPTLRVEYRVGDAPFALPPLITVATDENGDEIEVEVDPSEYDAVRWTLLRALEPAETITLSYRVVVR